MTMMKRMIQKPAERSHSRSGGFTLIEVVIAMAIFIIGAVAIIRIFPPGLEAIQGSERRSTGAREAASVLSRWSTQPDLVPDWIYNVTPVDGLTYDPNFDGAFNGSVSRNFSLPRDLRTIGDGGSAIEKFKRIEGEKHKVFRNPGTTELYILTDFPYTTGSLRLQQEHRIEGVRVDHFGSNKYVFDFRSARLASTGGSWANTSVVANPNYYPLGVNTTPADQFTYYISYRWLANDTKRTVFGVVEEPYRFPDVVAGDPDALKVVLDSQVPPAIPVYLPGPLSIVEEEVPVRMVERLSLPAQYDGDNIRGMVRCDGATGIAGGAIEEGDIISVSYEVADWRWMVVDTPLTEGPDNIGVLTLPTRGLDAAYPSIYALSYNSPGTGTLTTEGIKSYPEGTPADGRPLAVLIDPTPTLTPRTTNSVQLDITDLDAPRGRIVYRALDGWARQISVAARSYVPFMNFNTSSAPGYVRQPWRDYWWLLTQNVNRVYFRPSEAGKTVLISYEYTTNGTNRFVVRDAVVPINENTVSGSSTSVPIGPGLDNFVDDGGRQVAEALLTAPDGTPFGAAATGTPRVTAILSVRGLSVQARTMWAEGSRYQQTVASDYRKVDRS
jgi:hypothetical protein